MQPLLMTYFGTATLGGLLDALSAPDVDTLSHISFDFCGIVPDVGAEGGVKPYRGFLEHVAIGWRVPDYATPVTLYSLRCRLANAIYKTMQSHSGEAYRVTRNTPVWVDNYGEASATAIVGINSDSGTIVLQTKQVTL